MERHILPCVLSDGDAPIFGYAQLRVHFLETTGVFTEVCVGMASSQGPVALALRCRSVRLFTAIRAKLLRIDQHNVIAQMAMIDNPTKAMIATRIANALASVLTPVARCTARNQLAQTGARPTAMAARSGFVAWLPAHTTARSFVAFPSDACTDVARVCVDAWAAMAKAVA